MSDIDRIGKIIREHQYYWGTGGTRCMARGCEGWRGYPLQHARHVTELIAEVLRPRIETVEQLDALPFLTIVREVYGPSASGCDYGGVWERRTSGWECIAGTVMPPGYESPRLPCRVLYMQAVDQ